MQDDRICQRKRCKNPLPPNRPKFCSRRCAKYAAVLRYRDKLGLDYLTADAARKRLAREAGRLRADLGAPKVGTSTPQLITYDDACDELTSIKRALAFTGPHLKISKRIVDLELKLGPCSDRHGAQIFIDCEDQRLEVGDLSPRPHEFTLRAKGIELFRLEQYDYPGFIRTRLTRENFHRQLSQNPWDEDFNQAVWLAEFIRAVLEGPLRGKETSIVQALRFEHARCNLRLAEHRGDRKQVQTGFDEICKLVEKIPAFAWEMNLEGIGANLVLGKPGKARDCLNSVSSETPPPGLLNQLRRARAETEFWLKEREPTEVRRVLVEEFRGPCQHFQMAPYARFWEVLKERYDLPGLGCNELRLVPRVPLLYQLAV